MRVADHSSVDEVKNDWSYTPLPHTPSRFIRTFLFFYSSHQQRSHVQKCRKWYRSVVNGTEVS